MKQEQQSGKHERNIHVFYGSLSPDTLFKKPDEFDLIVFDRYKLRGILPQLYLENIANYVRDGGAVLVAAGPDYASASSLFRSPLGAILPGAPTSRVIEEGFIPKISDLGQRHPVTEGLEDFAPAAEDGETPGWGRWLRQIDVEAVSGQTVMEGIDGRPLLLLDRIGEGRISLIASDHAWLWSRGYEGGGPQLELLRRLAHWMMGEPELEEEALTAIGEGGTLTLRRRTLSDSAEDITVTRPDGSQITVRLAEVSPGRWEAELDAPDIGLYRLSDGETETVVALGPAAPREFERTIASGDLLADVVSETRGGIMRLEEGFPDVRRARVGRPAAGRGWIAITPREAYLTADVRITPFLPAWIFLLIAAALTIGAWLYEGRRSPA